MLAWQANKQPSPLSDGKEQKRHKRDAFSHKSSLINSNKALVI